MMKHALMALLLGLSLAAVPALAANAPFAEVDKAGIFLRDFEKEVERAQGADTGRYFNKQEALSRIKRLAQQYPDDPKVKELVKRASAALMKRKGGYMEITPEMLAYKRNEKELRERFKTQNQEAWQKALTEKAPITNVFPTPDPEAVDLTNYVGKYILLEDVRYPANLFVGGSGEYIYTGKPSSGFYFISMQSRQWAGPYEAIRRYRSMVDASLGDNLTFSVLGKITGVVMESTDPAPEKHSPVTWGWVVAPEMLYAGDRVLATYDPQNENSGFFYGEDEVEKIKDSWYTVKSIPDNVDPKRLMEIFATAIKEKNYKLYMQCIYPARGDSDVGSSLIRYHWDLHQARFQNEYVHAVFDEPKITVLKGLDENNDLEGYFLDPSQRERINKMSGEREEMAVVMSRAFDENGKQRGSKNRHELRRKGNGRWYVNTYDVRF
ncbi:MAG: hypothetical protein J5828_02675 [Desulfovibrionaceae bacterium]|nr:hypothetical protein [Desulfovibrionaceae bacterium]